MFIPISNLSLVVVQIPSSLSRPVMFSYSFFQNGFIFCALVFGLACLIHLVACKMSTCKNWHVLFSIILTGLVHLIYCAYMLDHFNNVNANNDLYSHDSSSECLDFTCPSDLANILTFSLILHCVIQRNFRIPYVVWLLELACGGFIITGLFKKLHDSVDTDLLRRQDQESFLTIGTSDTSSTGMYWSICKTIVSAEKFNFIFEYGLIYIPVFLVVVCAISKQHSSGKKSHIHRLKILKRKCVTDSGEPCSCTGLNKALTAVLMYSFLLLLVARPAMIIYSHVTSGSFRDVYPGLTNSVVYCFLCGEYLLVLVKDMKTSNRMPTVTSKVLKVDYAHQPSEKKVPLMI